MAKIRCSIGYKKLPLDAIDTFAGGVRDGIFGNPIQFPTSPVLQPAFQACIDDYFNTRSAYKQGGKAQKGPFLLARQKLFTTLDLTAEYVDSVANGNESLILLSGFVPTKGTSTNVPLPPQLVDIELTRGSTGEIFAQSEPLEVGDTYVCIMTAGGPIPSDITISGTGQLTMGDLQQQLAGASASVQQVSMAIFDFTRNRKKKFMGLTPGITYWFSFFAINATGVGPLSEPKSIVCW
jgi:hypothetical protein